MPIAQGTGAPSPAATHVPPPCRYCGYPLPAAPCSKCGETLLHAPGGTPMKAPPRRRFFVIDLVRGFFGFFEGMVLLFNRPEFIGKLKLPVAANLVAVTATAVLLWLAFRALFANIAGEGDLFGWFTGILAPLLALVSTYFLLPPIVELVLSPFLEPLVDVVEDSMGGPDMQPVQRHLWTNVKESTHAAAQLLMLALGVWLLTLALAMVGLVLVGFLLAAWVNALTWFELPAYRRGYGLAERWRLLRHNWALATGFGLAFQVGALIPLFNVFLLAPSAAVGAAVLYLRMEKPASAVVR